MAFVPAKDPGNFYTRQKAAAGQLNAAIATGRSLLGAANPGGQIALNQVRGIRTIGSRPTNVPTARSASILPFGNVSMQVPRFASTPVCGRSAPDGPSDMWPSQNNPFYLQRSAMPYGRQLRGLGLLPDASPAWGDTWSGNDPALNDAAQADDVAGNGIFDGAGSPPTAHANTGVFESRFSLPGYLYREQPTQPSEIRDTTTGMPVVYQPNAGGSWYDDVRDAYRPFDVETPRLYDNRPVFQPKMLPSVALPRTSSVSGLGEFEMTSETAKAMATWAVVGAMAAFGGLLIYKSLMPTY